MSVQGEHFQGIYSKILPHKKLLFIYSVLGRGIGNLVVAHLKFYFVDLSSVVNKSFGLIDAGLLITL